MKWQRIDTAPKDGRWVTVYTEGDREGVGLVQSARWVDTSEDVWVDVDETTRKRERRISGYWGGCDGWPTHWIEIPPPTQEPKP